MVLAVVLLSDANDRAVFANVVEGMHVQALIAHATVALGDSVGLIEDNRGPDHHNDGIGPWLHLVFPELLDLAIN